MPRGTEREVHVNGSSPAADNTPPNGNDIDNIVGENTAELGGQNKDSTVYQDDRSV